jgi:hypothetical protein
MRPITSARARLTALAVLCLLTAGCLEGTEDFHIHSDGSGVLEVEAKISKKFSELLALSFKGKTPQELSKLALTGLAENYEGVHWESASQALVGGHVVIKAKGVFPDIRRVRHHSTALRFEDRGEREVGRHTLSFEFAQGPKGGKATLALAYAKLVEVRPPSKEDLKAIDETLEGLKVAVRVRPPGTLSTPGLQAAGQGRAGFEITRERLKGKGLEQSLSALGGEIRWTGSSPPPAGFAKRLAAAKVKAEAAPRLLDALKHVAGGLKRALRERIQPGLEATKSERTQAKRDLLAEKDSKDKAAMKAALEAYQALSRRSQALRKMATQHEELLFELEFSARRVRRELELAVELEDPQREKVLDLLERSRALLGGRKPRPAKTPQGK